MVPEKTQKKIQGEFAAFEIARPKVDLGFGLELIISESLTSFGIKSRSGRSSISSDGQS